MSGYDIKKMVEVALTHFWNESYGQIFPALNRLVEDGLATRRVDPKSGGRRRQVYKATAAGRRVFNKWLKLPASRPRLRDELKLKFFLTSRGNPAESIRLLEEYEEQQQAHLAVLRESEVIFKAALQGREMPEELQELQQTMGWDQTSDADKQVNELLMFYLTLRNGILVEEARVAWVKEILPILRDKTIITKSKKKHVGPRVTKR
jgi:DNA-binding PadR family transcriptional regulator